MERIQVASSNIASAGFDPDSSKLQIEFKDGAIYDYLSVPAQHFDGLLSANSPGRYFHLHIKDRYRFERVS
jgi:hypothetical protein